MTEDDAGYRQPFVEDDQGLAQVQPYQPPADLREALTRGLAPGAQVNLAPLEDAGLIPREGEQGWPGGGE
jgi:hypothetical protein